jgi:hypothetical protein
VGAVVLTAATDGVGGAADDALADVVPGSAESFEQPASSAAKTKAVTVAANRRVIGRPPPPPPGNPRTIHSRRRQPETCAQRNVDNPSSAGSSPMRSIGFSSPARATAKGVGRIPVASQVLPRPAANPVPTFHRSIGSAPSDDQRVRPIEVVLRRERAGNGDQPRPPHPSPPSAARAGKARRDGHTGMRRQSDASWSQRLRRSARKVGSDKLPSPSSMTQRDDQQAVQQLPANHANRSAAS